MKKKRVLITGAAGFIGFHLAKHLKKQQHDVIGLDNFSSYYDVRLKRTRAALLQEAGITIIEGDIANRTLVASLLDTQRSTHIVHLAATAGVRYSITNPEVYLKSNIDGFLDLLEVCKERPHISLVFASSSSVYGKNQKVPFSESDHTDQPTNPYGMTKKTNELMAFAYHTLYKIPCIGLRFFTVYGPWGRPDMAYFLFTKAIFEDRPIELYNFGKMRRDFTYIDDIIQGIEKSLELETGYEIFNLGNSKVEELGKLVSLLEKETGRSAQKKLLPMPQGEIIETYADCSKSEKILGYRPTVSLEEGITKFVTWYRDYFPTLV